MRTRSEPPRSVKVLGRRTSMRLEGAYWEALEEIARREASDLEYVLDLAASGPHRGNLSSAIRLFVLAYFRDKRRLPRGPARRRTNHRAPV